jgi:hypothetical protein
MGNSLSMLGCLTQDIERWLLVSRSVARTIVKLLVNNISNLLVQRSQRDIRRTDLVAQATVNAPTCHVDGPGKMEYGILRWEVTRMDEILTFQ